MKREDLKDLNLSDDAIDKIMALHGKDIQALNTKVNDLQAERDTYKGQSDDFKKQVDNLTKDAKNGSEAQKQVQELQAKIKESDNNWNAKLTSLKTDNAIELALRDAGVKDTRTVIPLLNKDSIKLNDKGELEGLKDQIPNLQKDHGYLFNNSDSANENKSRVELPNGNPASNGSKDVSLTDRIAQRLEKME